MSDRHALMQEDKHLFWLGLAVLAVGVVCNEWVLKKIFSADGVLELETRIIIWFFNVLMILLGLGIIKYKKISNMLEKLLGFSRSYPRMSAILVGMAFSGVLLFSVEVLFYVITAYIVQSDEREWHTEGTLTERDDVLGYKHLPNTRVSAQFTFNDKVIYNVFYSTDEYGRRVTPIENLEQHTRFMLFFGGSFTFGQGLNDHETIPFFMAQLAPQYRPYNYGVMGYGPQGMLAKLQSNELNKEITEENGKLVYIFIDHHFDRAIGSMSVHNSWGNRMPYYTLGDDDKLVRKGNFTDGRPIMSFLYKILGASQIATYFGVDFPSKTNDYAVKLTARMFEESLNLFEKQFGNDDFYVVFYPGSKRAQRLIPAFERAGIKYLDYSDLLGADLEEFQIEGDGHPTALANRVFAARLAKDLDIQDMRTNRQDYN